MIERHIRALQRAGLWPINECVHLGRAIEAVALVYATVTYTTVYQLCTLRAANHRESEANAERLARLIWVEYWRARHPSRPHC